MTAHVKMTVRLPVELNEKLNSYARNEELSKNQVIKKALKSFIEVDKSTRT